MVRGRSVGFVVPDADMRTYAHELGHGVFGLEHTFPEIPQTPNIDNLMAYGTGTHLTHEQWKIIHARKPAYSWFDSEEDGSIYSYGYFKIGDTGILNSPTYTLDNVSQGTNINFVTPNGKIIQLPNNTKVSFAGYLVDAGTSNMSSASKNGIGVLMTFYSADGKYWSWDFESNTTYKNETKTETYVATFLTGVQPVIIGVEESDCKVTLYKGDYTSSPTPMDYVAQVALTLSPKTQIGFKQIPPENCLTGFAPANPDNDCFGRATTKGLKVITAGISFAVFTAAVEYGICSTEKEKLALTDDDTKKFVYGFSNSLFQAVDVAGMAQGISESIIAHIKTKYDCLTSLQTTPIVTREDLIRVVLECSLGMNPAQITAFGELPSVLMTYIKENYTDPYEQGQMVAYVLTSFIPVGGQLKFAKLVAKGNPKWLKFVQKLDNIPAGNITDAINLIKAEKDLLTRLDAYPNLKTAVNNLTPTKKQQFLDDFVDASDDALTRMNNAPICLNYWKNSASGDIIGANAEAFAKQYEAMILLKQGDFTGVASLYNKSFTTVEYVLDGAPNLTVLAEARLIANRINDIPVIAQKMGVPEAIIREVKEHFFVTEHFMEINGNFQKGRFERASYDIALWKAAENNGLVNGYSFIEDGVTFSRTSTEALAEFNRLIAHEYIESKLMKEGFLYRNYLNNGNPNEFNFGAHDLSISTNSGNPNEYIMLTNYIKSRTIPTAFNGDWSKLNQITSELLTIFK